MAGRARVAVLGATGFVGRAVSEALLAEGHEVLGVARTPRAVAPGAGFVSLDLSRVETAELAGVLAGFGATAVVNAAGGMWGLTEAEMVEANVTLVARLTAAVGSLAERPRIVHLGSVHEYGLAPVGVTMTEDRVPEPVTAYGKLKLECADLVLDAARRGEAEGLVLRVGNVVGARQPGHSLLGVVAARLLEARREGVACDLKLGPLGSQRDFLALADAAEAVAHAATVEPAVTGQVVNIGTGRAHSARELVHLLMDASGVPATLTEAEPPTAVETDWQQMGVEHAAAVLGWRPRRTLADAVAELWAAEVAAEAGGRVEDGASAGAVPHVPAPAAAPEDASAAVPAPGASE
jgi:dTDP-6-deoxy-L-talose 4-dehydrogenase [NAD(P)+]